MVKEGKCAKVEEEGGAEPKFAKRKSGFSVFRLWQARCLPRFYNWLLIHNVHTFLLFHSHSLGSGFVGLEFSSDPCASWIFVFSPKKDGRIK
jgi:hypothetical protein